MCVKGFDPFFPNTEIEPEVLHVIRSAIQFSMPVGNERFVKDIERITGYSLGYAKKGRPGIREENTEYLIWE